MARRTKATRQQNYYGDFEPVKRIELSEKHVKLRAIVAVLFAAVGIFFIVRGVLSALGADSGIRQIDAKGGSAASEYAQEFALSYNIGVSGVRAAAESRAIQSLYTQLLEDAKAEYSLDALNASAGSQVRLSSGLYEALEALNDAGGAVERLLFMAPVQELYKNVFYSQNDEEAAKLDPYKDADTAAFLKELTAFVSSPEHVKIELGSGSAKLVVSDSYRAYAKANGIEEFVSFSWLENSLIVDYVADGLIKEGYRLGTIASYDGSSRGLYESDGYAQVFFKSAPTIQLDHNHFYVYADGSMRHCWLRPSTGLCADIPESLGEKIPGAENSCFKIMITLAKKLLK